MERAFFDGTEFFKDLSMAENISTCLARSEIQNFKTWDLNHERTLKDVKAKPLVWNDQPSGSAECAYASAFEEAS